MSLRRLDSLRTLLVFGSTAFLLAGLSIVDMFLPRPYDGVVLETDVPGLVVRQVVPGSGADVAGLRPGDEIWGIARDLLSSVEDAAEQLHLHRVGETVPYLVKSPDRGARELRVELGRRRIGDPSYLYACLLGFSFFFVGLFVLLRQPSLRASQVFFVVCTLFMLFLICRLRPSSYSWMDRFVLSTGTMALLFLPATFLHFFVIFPHPVWRRLRLGRELLRPGLGVRLGGALAIYGLPPLVLLASHLAKGEGQSLRLISGAPIANWWVLAAYMVLGLAVLAFNALSLEDRRERRGAGLVFFGSLFGLVPFLVLAVGFPSLLHTDRFLFYGVIPLILVPVTFAYAIVRFQLLDIRVLLRKSLFYTLTTAVVTGLYALGIALFNSFFRGSEVSASPYFPILLALAIVLLFEPLRRRLQVPVDRFFYAERSRLQRAMEEMGEAITAHGDLGEVVRDLVEKLPQLLRLHFAALYLVRGESLERVAGPSTLPDRLPVSEALHRQLRRRGGLNHLDELGTVGLRSGDARNLLRRLAGARVEVLGDLSSARQGLGLIALSGKSGQLTYEPEELRLLKGLLNQASIALETHRLLEERTRRAELERELEIAAGIQSSLLPGALELAPGWRVAAACVPARHVGGDFITKLPGLAPGSQALAYGDVSGKSVSGALVMMAAYEILGSLAMTTPDPVALVELANQRLYRLGKLGRKGFVALGYFAASESGEALSYLLAGQPPPLRRDLEGRVSSLTLPRHRLPLGGLASGGYQLLSVPLRPGEMVLGYSDGVLEAHSPRGELFGAERLGQLLTNCPSEPESVVREVLNAVSTFTGGSEPYDDLTLVAVRRERETSQ